MAKVRITKVEINRQALNELELACADGLLDITQRAADLAQASSPSRRVARSIAAMSLAQGKKVGGQGDKPRETRANRPGLVIGVVGAGHPLAHLFERGTVDRYTRTPARYTGRMTPRPFLLPAVQQAVGELGPAIGRAIARRLPK